MLSAADKFFNDVCGKKIALMGIGVTNTELIKLLHKKGAVVTACDRRSRSELSEAARELEALGVSLKLGETYFDGLDADILFRTPGMNFHLPKLVEFKANGGIVTSEMEVFFDACPCPIIAVTGSDGKTTTTTLIAKILEEQGKTVHLGGNIGKALLPHVFEMDETDIAVVELSSFQLISMRGSPKTAVVTNITPNHLDVHRDMLEYITAKKNIFIHQNAFSRTVLGFDNDITAGFAPEVRGECMTFSLVREMEHGAWLDSGGSILFNSRGESTFIMNASDIRLPGRHNIANYLAAICAVWGLAEPKAMRKVAKEFGGVPHRIEFIRELDGVKWYNDSIATTPARAIAGLRSFERKIILIAGGYDKKIPYEPLAPEIISHVKLLILTGETGPKIEAAVLSHPDYTERSPGIVKAENLENAVKIARQAACKGDIVSLSPASASFDAYQNFEARGHHFKELVNTLE